MTEELTYTPEPNLDYQAWLDGKIDISEQEGFNLEGFKFHPSNKPHQTMIIRRALKDGKMLIAAAFGLGKSQILLEIARAIHEHTGQRILFVAQLGVRHQFVNRDGVRLGMQLQYCASDDEVTAADTPYIITNYERVLNGNIDPRHHNFACVCFDEGNIMRSLDAKTYEVFQEVFADVPYQFIATATPAPNEYREIIYYANFLGKMDNGQALAQPLDADILTPTGYIKMGNVKIGDSVISVDGQPAPVVGIYPQGEKDIYRVVFSDGASAECTSEHLWLTHTQYERNNEKRYNGRNKHYKPYSYATLKTTEGIAGSLVSATGGVNHSIPLVAPVEFAKQSVKVHPYVMGVLLGDGHLRETSVSLTSKDQFIIDRLADIVAPFDLEMHKSEHVRKDGRETIDYSITNGRGKGHGGGQGNHTNVILQGFREYGLLGKHSWDKFVPQEYLFNSSDVRIEVLRGLMDTDGTIDVTNRCVRYITTSEQLARDVVFLVQSFGGIANVYEREPKESNAEVNGRVVQSKLLQYHVSINMPNGINPFSLPRKAGLVIDKTSYKATRYIVKVEFIGKKEAQCIAVDHDSHLYLTNDFIVTHNTRWFGRNPDKAGDLQLLPQFEREFWLWVSTWAVFLNKPSDLGFDDDGYNTPGLDIHWHRLPIDYTKAWAQTDNRGQGRMFQDASSSAVDLHRNKRETMQARLDKAKEIIAETDDNILLWHLFEYERDAIERQVPGAVTVYGSQSPEEKEKGIMDFEDGKTKILATKASIAGSGCNFQQHCHTNIFMSLDFSFNDLIQAIKRTDRFQQMHKVQVHFIYSEDEDSIVAAIKRKWSQYDALTANMSGIIRRYGLNHNEISSALRRKKGVEREEVKGNFFTAVKNDCVLELYDLPDNSVDYMLTSIPFGNHYEYTTQIEDFGHNPNDNDFWVQMGFLIPQLYRVLKPGRKLDVHVKDRVLYGHQTWHGFTEISNFLGEARREFPKWGFIDHGFRVIVTDVVRENNSTYRLGWSECCKDSSKMGSGLPEYLVSFRKQPSNSEQQYADERVVHNKPGTIGAHCPSCGWWGNEYEGLDRKIEVVYNDNAVQEEREVGRKCPVCSETVHRVKGNEYGKGRWQIDAHSFWRSNGDSLISQELYDYIKHVEIAEADNESGALPSTFMKYPPESHSPFVWGDVMFMQGLNSAQVGRKVRKHICPLPFDIVQRAIYLNSNPGDLVLDPFAGLFTVPYMAVKLGRRGYGIEINPESFRDGVKYMQDIELKRATPTLFDIFK